jgi:hypothetical protein
MKHFKLNEKGRWSFAYLLEKDGSITMTKDALDYHSTRLGATENLAFTLQYCSVVRNVPGKDTSFGGDVARKKGEIIYK